MFKQKIAIAALAAQALWAQGPASAQTVEFRYKSYELSSSAGQRAVAERVRKQVRRACLREMSVGARFGYHNCMDDIGGQIIGKIDHPAVSAFWSRKAPAALAARP